MIYLIGGVTKSGKTYVAKEILKRYNIPVFQTDFLLWGLGSEKKNEGMFNYYSPDKDVSPILEPIITKIISFLVNNQDYIIEGTHVTTSLYLKLNVLYPGKIKACFLGYTNTDPFTKYNEIIESENSIENKWYKKLSVDDFLNVLNDKISESNEIKEECNNHGIRYYDIFDITNQKEEIIKDLLSKY